MEPNAERSAIPFVSLLRPPQALGVSELWGPTGRSRCEAETENPKSRCLSTGSWELSPSSMTALTQPAHYYTTVSNVEALEEQKTPSVPPSYGAPGRVLLATGQRTTPAFRALQIAGHDVT